MTKKQTVIWLAGQRPRLSVERLKGINYFLLEWGDDLKLYFAPGDGRVLSDDLINMFIAMGAIDNR